MTNDDLIRRGDAIRIVKGAWARSKTPEDFYALTVTAFENILPFAQPEQNSLLPNGKRISENT